MNLDPGYFSGIATSGSVDYYALLFCPHAERKDFRILLAFEGLLNELSLRDIEPDVRQAKLGWWANELSRMTTGSAVHPLSIAVSEVLNRRNLPDAPLVELFSAIARETGNALPTNPDELLSHAGRRGAMLPLLGQLVASGNSMSENSRKACLEIGAARYFALVFGSSKHDHHRHQPTEQPDSPAPQTIESQVTSTQAERMRLAVEGMPLAERPRLVPILVLSRLVHDHLPGLRSAPQNSLGSQLRRLATAWRCARRASRGKLPF